MKTPTGPLTGLFVMLAALTPLLAAPQTDTPQTDTALAGITQADVDGALRRFPRNPWYDKQSQQFVPPEVQPARDEPLRQTGRVNPNQRSTKKNTNSSGRWWDWNLSWLDLTWLAAWFPTLVFTALGIALVVVIGLLTYYSLRHYMPHRFQQGASSTAVAIDLTRLEELPFEVAATDAHPLARAEQLMRAGDFDSAIVFLYGYLLLVLDQSRMLHLQKGKTNRMYLRELRGAARLRELVQAAMHVFEACYFGKHPVTREEYMSVWARVAEFHQLVQTTPQAPAEAPRSTPSPAEVL